MPAVRLLQLGPAMVDLGASRIISSVGETRLEPKVQQVLELLLAAEGALVSKDELLDRVWGDVHVTDAVVFRCIRILRQALGEDAALGGPIEMLRGRGYRLAWPVAAAPDAGPGPEPVSGQAEVATATPAWSVPRWAAAGGAAASVLVAALIVMPPVPPGPDAPLAPVSAADAAIELGRREYARYDRPGLESAMHHFERAVRLDPRSAGAHAGMALTLVARYSLGVGGDSALEAGAAVAQRAIALDSEMAEAHRASALAAIARGRLREAKSALERALALDPTHAAARDNLAALYVESGRPDIALAMFQTTPDSSRPAWVTRVNQAGALLALGEAERAWRVIEGAAQDAPYQPAVVATAAQIESYLGRSREAGRRVTRALAVYPDSAILWRTRGDLDLLDGRFSEAVEAYRRVDELSVRDDPGARLGLAYALRQLGAAAEAETVLAVVEAQLSERLAAGDESFRPRALLARLEAHRGRAEASLAWLDEATARGLLSTRWAHVAPEFESLRASHGFVDWVAEVRSHVDGLGARDGAGPPGLAY